MNKEKKDETLKYVGAAVLGAITGVALLRRKEIVEFLGDSELGKLLRKILDGEEDE